ncbi:uncharacterized protein LOC128210740 [Mya arenaria]|uniref:uncharacterized protein LOC128210740 n=1 Tax=Mya arenaria TaxID=6604 RepID=UPI0022E3EA03|nr:uncharacterized protein LOC128210740 [Mya arenaria]
MHTTWTLLVIQLLSYQALGFLFTNERSNQCPSLSAETAFIEYIDNVTMLIEIPKELELVQELTFHSGECNVNYHMAPVTLDVEDQEKGDISTQMLSYDKNVILPISPLIRTAKFAFDEPLYTERIKLRSSYPLGCVRVHVNGCGTSGMCRRETSPCGYNGICIGEQRCACTPPYVGRICNSKANDILIDDYSPILQMQKVVFTKAGKLQTYGNVTVVQDDSTGRRSRRTFGYFGGHHYYQMHGGSCMPQTSQSYPSSNFYGHHCSSSPYSVFHNSHNNGFSHSCNAIFGHSHDHQSGKRQEAVTEFWIY